MSAQRFGRWQVISAQAPKGYAICRCECGVEKPVYLANLHGGKSTSCGCRWADNSGENSARRKIMKARHGLNWVDPANPWYRRSNGIYRRCKTEAIEFGFASVSECASYLISIAPEHCPVFGIKLRTGAGAFSPDAPSVDRMRPQVGYVRGNLQVISLKANVMKTNATTAELKMFAEWVIRTQAKED